MRYSLYYSNGYQNRLILRELGLIVELHLLAEVVERVLLPMEVLDLGLEQLYFALEMVFLSRIELTFLCR